MKNLAPDLALKQTYRVVWKRPILNKSTTDFRKLPHFYSKVAKLSTKRRNNKNEEKPPGTSRDYLRGIRKVR